MKNVLVLGAGRSATALIDELSHTGQQAGWTITVVDAVEETIAAYAQRYANVRALTLDIFDATARGQLLGEADLVISMLPARFHIHVAITCLELGKHLITASYVSEEIRKLAPQAEAKGLIFLFECGLDPGLDHMSAMQAIDRIRDQGGTIDSFQSFCGGLMAPGSDDNPWRYKFTWNPRNVVLAGSMGTAQYLYKGRYKNIPHHQLFKRLTEVSVPDYGDFESYPNRDSLHYRELYGLYDAQTILRGTLRRPGFCSAWHAFVQLGLTDDRYPVRNVENMTYADFVRAYLPYSEDDLKVNFSRYLGEDINSERMQRIRWLGLFDETPIGLQAATPADVIQKLLESKWTAAPDDEDMVAMQHQFEYQLDGQPRRLTTSLVVTGQLSGLTAMAKTVGYPMAVATRLILNDRVKRKGLLIPIHREIYEPILAELPRWNIHFEENEEVLAGSGESNRMAVTV